jgi:ABC-2 type transport system permease protein
LIVGGLANIYWLGTKELRSLLHDKVMLLLVVYAFTFVVYSMATGFAPELKNASIAIVDEDRSQLSGRLVAAFLPPYFRPPEMISADQIDRRMDVGRDTFVIDIPPDFQADVLAGRRPALQVNVDATAVMQAGIGAGYVQQIVSMEVNRFLGRSERETAGPAELVVRMAFNPNLTVSWFTGVMAIINNITMAAVVLAGAAVIREREHGTMDHLMVMPLRSLEIALAKVWANGLVITILASLSLWLVVQKLLGMPVIGSRPLFIAGIMLYLFFATAVGILLGTVARSMPQLGLLFFLVVLPMNLLSGSNTPLESMPRALQTIMSVVPTTHFVALAQGILYRGAGFAIVWPHFLAMAAGGLAVFALALLRFRASAAASVG